MSVAEPVGFFVDRQVGLLLPIVCAAVRQDECSFEAALAGEFTWAGSEMPFSGDIGVVTAILKERG